MVLQDLIEKNKKEWEQYLHHDFIRDLANSKLKMESFKHYLVQDYIFLKNVSKIYALAVYKSKDINDLKFFSLELQALLDENLLQHIKFCEQQGISKDELRNTEEEISTIAYTRYLLDIANSYSLNEILVSLAPYMVGHYDFAARIGKQIIFNPKIEPYKIWIDIYKDEKYVNSVKNYENFLNDKIKNVQAESKDGENILKIFKTALKCETSFFEQSYGKFHSQGLCLIRRIFG